MQTNHLVLDEVQLVDWIAMAQTRVILALPSLPQGIGKSLAQAHRRLGGSVLAVIDPDERVYRVGYGSFSEVSDAFNAGFPLLGRSGLRLGCGLVDDLAFFMALPPQLVEAAPELTDSQVNAVVVDSQAVLAYLRGIANGPELDEVLEPRPDLPPLVQEDPIERLKASQEAHTQPPQAEIVSGEVMIDTKVLLEMAPPLNFQVHRQSMVYTSLLVYVVVDLNGCRLDNREISVGKALLPLLGEKAELMGRRTFQLKVDHEFAGLSEIRRRVEHLRTRIARNLGKPYGTVLLRQDREAFEEEQKALEALIRAKHPEAIEAFKKGLTSQIEDILQVCLKQCMAAMTPGDIILALRPSPRHGGDFRLWERWRDANPSLVDLKTRLGERIQEALWNNVNQMMRHLSNPKLEVTIREFTLEQMDEGDFRDRLLDVFGDKEDLRPYLENRAVIGKPTKPQKETSFSLIDEEVGF